MTVKILVTSKILLLYYFYYSRNVLQINKAKYYTVLCIHPLNCINKREDKYRISSVKFKLKIRFGISDSA